MQVSCHKTTSLRDLPERKKVRKAVIKKLCHKVQCKKKRKKEEGSAYVSITGRYVHTYPQTDNYKEELKTIAKSPR